MPPFSRTPVPLSFPLFAVTPVTERATPFGAIRMGDAGKRRQVPPQYCPTPFPRHLRIADGFRLNATRRHRFRRSHPPGSRDW